jgi:hypothetical protein
LFKYQGAFIVNERGKVMDVDGGQDVENRNIIVWNKHGGLNQQWDVIYVDEYPAEPVKGELNEQFGLYVERPFHIVSELGEHRLLTTISNKLAIKTKNANSQQVWWFDQKSLTIRNKNGNKSLNINSNGNARTISVYNTNSAWW